MCFLEKCIAIRNLKLDQKKFRIVPMQHENYTPDSIQKINCMIAIRLEAALEF
jgi:hypothetical protein